MLLLLEHCRRVGRRITVGEMAVAFGVSESTVNRDLRVLRDRLTDCAMDTRQGSMLAFDLAAELDRVVGAMGTSPVAGFEACSALMLAPEIERGIDKTADDLIGRFDYMSIETA